MCDDGDDKRRMYVVPVTRRHPASAPKPIPPYAVSGPVRQTQHEIDQCTSESLLDCFQLVKQGLMDRYPPSHGNVTELEARTLAATMMGSWEHFERGPRRV